MKICLACVDRLRIVWPVRNKLSVVRQPSFVPLDQRDDREPNKLLNEAALTVDQKFMAPCLVLLSDKSG